MARRRTSVPVAPVDLSGEQGTYRDQWGGGLPLGSPADDDRAPPAPWSMAGPGREAAENLRYAGLLGALATRVADYHEPGLHPPLGLLRQISEAIAGAWRLPDTPNQTAMRDKAIERAKRDFELLDCVHHPWPELSRLLRAAANTIVSRCDSQASFDFERSVWLARELLAIWLRVLDDSRPAA